MKNNLLHEELIFFNFEADSRDDLLLKLAQVLLDKGYVKPSYIEGVIEREKNYPTGLNTEGVKVAIPHTDSIHVKKTGILVAKLKKPIIFNEMGNDLAEVNSELIFMIAMKDSKSQLSVLSKLMDVFSNGEKLRKLSECKEPKEFIEILSD